MQNKHRITIGHPFYFPTQIALVDDDHEFLEGLSLMLNPELSCLQFPSALKALDYLNTAHQHAGILKRCYSSYKTGPMASDALTHIDISKLHMEVLNPHRFSTVSTLVIDYSMPEMNGLEFLASLKNPFVKKILLTGRGDMEMAVRAFNSQLIDQYIDKHDPNLKTRLNDAIAAFQDQYFRSSFKLVTDQILANNHEGFLASAEFQQYFSGVCGVLDTVEYYLLDEPHAGFLMVDANGSCHIMLIHTDESLKEHLDLISPLLPPESLVRALQNQAYLPAYDDKQEALKSVSPFLRQWKDHYRKTEHVASQKSYHVALYPVERTTMVQAADIQSFNAFQQLYYPVNTILH